MVEASDAVAATVAAGPEGASVLRRTGPRRSTLACAAELGASPSLRLPTRRACRSHPAAVRYLGGAVPPPGRGRLLAPSTRLCMGVAAVGMGVGVGAAVPAAMAAGPTRRRERRSPRAASHRLGGLA